MQTIQKVETKLSEIWIDEDGVLCLNIKEGAEIDLPEAERCFAIYERLGLREERRLQLITGGEFFSYDKEAQKYAAVHGKEFFIAAALVNNSLAVRLLFNFFNSFYKHPVPFKMFPTEAKAREWLKTLL